MAASAGTVTLELDANSVKLVRELLKAQRQTKRTGRQMRRDMEQSFRKMGQAAAVFTVALGAAVKASVNMADRIGKTADKLGIGVEALQEFRFAASQAGIAQNTLDMALQRFTRRAAEAARGTGEAKAAFKEMGIALTDTNGQMRKSEDLLSDVADALAKGYAPADQLRLAFKLFDSEGAIMVNMLRDGSEGLDRMRQSARDAGAVLDESLVRNAEEAANQMDKLQKVMQVQIATAVLENSESIIALTNALIGFVGVIGKAVKGWNDWAASQGIGVESLDEIRLRGNALTAERIRLEDRIEMLRKRAASFEGSPLQKNFLRQIMAAELALNKVIQDQIALQNQAVQLQKDKTTPEDGSDGGPTYNPITPPAEVDKDAESIAKIIKDLQDEVRSYGMGEESTLFQLVDLNATQEQLNAASDLLGQIKALQLEEENRKAAAQERADLENEYQQLIQSTLTDIERHAEVINRINELYQAGIIPSVEEYAEVVKRVNEEFQDRQDKQAGELDVFAEQAARNMQDALGQFLFNPFEEGVDGMVKGFARAMQQMIAEAAAAAIMKKLFGAEGQAGMFGSEGFGAFLGGIFGKAKGGPVFPGQPYLVGEEGPEIIVPQSMGTVIPNDMLQGQNVVNTNVYLPPQAQPRTAAQVAYEVANRQSRALARNR